MSGTLDAMILEKAVEIWRDPNSRMTGSMRDKREGRYCAVGVLIEAQEQITGKLAVFERDWDKLVQRIGYNDWLDVARMNDKNGRFFGQRYLYWRMKRALKKARA